MQQSASESPQALIISRRVPRIDAVLYVGDIARETRNHARYLISLTADSYVVMIAPLLLVPRKERGLCSQYLSRLLV